MKVVIAVLFICCVLLALVALLLHVATPNEWPLSPGSLSVDQITIKDEPYLLISGPPMNYTAQVQGIYLDYNPDERQFFVGRYRIRRNPLSKILVNNQWPVIYPLSSLPSGKYTVVHRFAGTNVIADIIEVRKGASP